MTLILARIYISEGYLAESVSSNALFCLSSQSHYEGGVIVIIIIIIIIIIIPTSQISKLKLRKLNKFTAFQSSVMMEMAYKPRSKCFLGSCPQNE